MSKRKTRRSARLTSEREIEMENSSENRLLEEVRQLQKSINRMQEEQQQMKEGQIDIRREMQRREHENININNSMGACFASPPSTQLINNTSQHRIAPSTTVHNQGACGDNSDIMYNTANMRTPAHTYSQMECLKYNAPICSMPSYNGSGSLKKFLSQFKDVCIINNWKAIEVKGMWLKMCLSERARDILYDNCADFDTLITRLHSRFGDHLMKQKYEMILPSRRRRQKEKLFHLADDIRHMVNIVYDELHPTSRERMAVKHFIMALNSPSAQYELSQRNFDTLDKALEAAQLREMYLGAEEPWNRRATTNRIDVADTPTLHASSDYEQEDNQLQLHHYEGDSPPSNNFVDNSNVNTITAGEDNNRSISTPDHSSYAPDMEHLHINHGNDRTDSTAKENCKKELQQPETSTDREYHQTKEYRQEILQQVTTIMKSIQHQDQQKTTPNQQPAPDRRTRKEKPSTPSNTRKKKKPARQNSTNRNTAPHHPGSSLHFSVNFDGIPTTAMIDTGSTHSLISMTYAKSSGLLNTRKILKTRNLKPKAANGSQIKWYGNVTVNMEIGNSFIPVELIVADIRENVIVGNNILMAINSMIDLSSMTLRCEIGTLVNRIPLISTTLNKNTTSNCHTVYMRNQPKKTTTKPILKTVCNQEDSTDGTSSTNISEVAKPTKGSTTQTPCFTYPFMWIISMCIWLYRCTVTGSRILCSSTVKCCSLTYRATVNKCSYYTVYSQQKEQSTTISDDSISSQHVSSYLSHPDEDTMHAEDGENSAEAIKVEPCQITSEKTVLCYLN